MNRSQTVNQKPGPMPAKVKANLPSHNTKTTSIRSGPNNKKQNVGKPDKKAASYTGIVNPKQLESIYSLLPNVPSKRLSTNQRQPDNNLNQTVETSKARKLSPQSEELIDAVMRQVAHQNKDKLSESDLVNLLAAVYLDTRANLDGKGSVVPSCTSTSTVASNELHSSQAPIPSTADEVIPTSVLNCSTPNPATTTMSISEKKRLQWEREKAEMTQLAAQLTAGRTNLLSHQPTDVVSQAFPFQSLPYGQSYVKPSEPTPCMVPPGSAVSLTPMGFSVNQAAQELKREEQRRQWLAELDDQVRQKRQQEDNNHLIQNAQMPHPNMYSNVNPPNLITDGSAAYLHPSASHFATPTAILPGPLTPALPVAPPSSISQAPVQGPHFGRPRRFFQEMYSNPAAEMAKLRRAEEFQRDILEQIEERRRLKEQEKAKKLLEDRLEEERLAKERERFRQLAEQEENERMLKQAESIRMDKVLSDGLKRAQEEAARHKQRPEHRTPTPEVFNGASLRRSPPPPERPRIVTSDTNKTAGDREVSVQCGDVPLTLSKETIACQTDVPYNAHDTLKTPAVTIKQNTPANPVPPIRKRITATSDRRANPQNSTVPPRGVPDRTIYATNKGASQSNGTNRNITDKNKTYQTWTNRGDRNSGSTVFNGNATYTRIPVPVSRAPGLPSATFSQSKDRYSDPIAPVCNAMDVVRTHDVLDPTSRSNLVSAERYPREAVRPEPRRRPLDSKPEPSPHHDALLRHLSDIRQGLKMRQMLYESGVFDDGDDS